MTKNYKSRSHKKQHFVPQCYTKGWHDPSAPKGSTATPYVWVFNRDGSNPRRKAPVNLFTETDIYTITLPDGGRDLRLEHGFQDLEDKFTRVRNLKFNRRAWPTDEEMAWALAFVATAQARTAAHRNFHRDQWRGIRERMEAMQAAMDRAPSSQRAGMALPEPRGANGATDRGLGIEDVLRIENQPIQAMIGPTIKSVLPALSRMHVAVLCTDDEIGFVTSDCPCVWFDPEAHKRPPLYRAPGLGSPTIEVTLPISPRQCLIISHEPELQGFVDLDLHLVDELNRRHIHHCDRSFISSSEKAKPIWFETRPMPEDAWEKVHAQSMSSDE
ncbi:DUF4238 domain-containing protein [Massilia varians]